MPLQKPLLLSHHPNNWRARMSQRKP